MARREYSVLKFKGGSARVDVTFYATESSVVTALALMVSEGGKHPTRGDVCREIHRRFENTGTDWVELERSENNISEDDEVKAKVLAQYLFPDLYDEQGQESQQGQQGQEKRDESVGG